ncbi:MAG: hypothetical protein PHF25_08055 [Candidatus Margulisbacteria bacterium]|nr:hypothetical protein [Candidatus Margulisiibacteriota bacterium]
MKVVILIHACRTSYSKFASNKMEDTLLHSQDCVISGVSNNAIKERGL